MREMGIAGITPGPNLSRRAQGHRVFPYLLRDLVIERPNQVWGIDITYIRLLGGWLYLVAIIDWFSRYAVAWELDGTLEMPFVMECVERALNQARPEIWNSDQGSHFTSPLYTEKLQQAGVRISMDGKGRALDNILTERLWRTLKYEEVYLHDYANPKEARKHLDYPILASVPGFGAVRVGELLAIAITPDRFRTKRQFWPYIGLAVVTKSSSDYKEVEGRIIKSHKVSTRGLNWNHNPRLKQVFKGAAQSALHRGEIRAYYQRLVERGTRPALARVSVARKLAAITLTLWKRKEKYDPKKITAQN